METIDLTDEQVRKLLGALGNRLGAQGLLYVNGRFLNVRKVNYIEADTDHAVLDFCSFRIELGAGAVKAAFESETKGRKWHQVRRWVQIGILGRRLYINVERIACLNFTDKISIHFEGRPEPLELDPDLVDVDKFVEKMKIAGQR